MSYVRYYKCGCCGVEFKTVPKTRIGKLNIRGWHLCCDCQKAFDSLWNERKESEPKLENSCAVKTPLSKETV